MQSKIFSIASLLLLLSLSNHLFAQQPIEYGSNKGKYLTINNTKVYYEEYGKGTPLLLLHGGLSTISLFSTAIPDLAKHFRVIVVDAPGEGRSEMADSVSFPLLATYSSKMIDLLGLDSLYVYGFSVGAITALHLAANRPDKVKMAVIHSGAFHYDGYGPGFGGDKVVPEMLEANPKFWLNEHLSKSPQKNEWKKYIRDFVKIFDNHAFIPEARLGQISAQVLILQGDMDLVKTEHAVQMNRLIKGSQLAILPSSTHFALYENPELVKRTIIDFLLKKQPAFRLGM
jgi:pimeloyl-ACP methyl ester carboxylesterase